MPNKSKNGVDKEATVNLKRQERDLDTNLATMQMEVQKEMAAYCTQKQAQDRPIYGKLSSLIQGRQ
eukprot:9490339-Heterocapsa_arctica.AAC.1